MAERKPLIDLAEMTSVATWPPQASAQQLALLDPSSQAMKRTPPLRNAAELVIRGTTVPSHASPVETGQSWVSLHMLGVIHTKFGTWPLLMSDPNWVKGTTCVTHRPGLLRMSLLYMRG